MNIHGQYLNWKKVFGGKYIKGPTLTETLKSNRVRFDTLHEAGKGAWFSCLLAMFEENFTKSSR